MSQSNVTSRAWAVRHDLDTRVHDTIVVDHLPQDYWSESLVIRPNGTGLSTRLDEPQLWAVCCAPAGDSTNIFDPELVYTFPHASGVASIFPLVGTEGEEYIVSTGEWDLATGEFARSVLWRVVMHADQSVRKPQNVHRIADVNIRGFLLGFQMISSDILVAADSSQGILWRIDIPSGKTTELFSDPTMLPPGANGGIFGVVRACFLENKCFFINTGTGKLFRTRFHQEADTVVHQGPIEELASGFVNADGLVVSNDGSTAYVCSYSEGHLWRIDIGAGGSGDAVVIHLRDDLTAPTAMSLVHDGDNERPTLYVLCNGKLSDDWLNSDKGRWTNLTKAKVEKLRVQVTVVTEVVYEYI